MAESRVGTRPNDSQLLMSPDWEYTTPQRRASINVSQKSPREPVGTWRIVRAPASGRAKLVIASSAVIHAAVERSTFYAQLRWCYRQNTIAYDTRPPSRDTPPPDWLTDCWGSNVSRHSLYSDANVTCDRRRLMISACGQGWKKPSFITKNSFWKSFFRF